MDMYNKPQKGICTKTNLKYLYHCCFTYGIIFRLLEDSIVDDVIDYSGSIQFKIKNSNKGDIVEY